jgi:hypothetical protein
LRRPSDLPAVPRPSCGPHQRITPALTGIRQQPSPRQIGPQPMEACTIPARGKRRQWVADRSGLRCRPSQDQRRGTAVGSQPPRVGRERSSDRMTGAVTGAYVVIPRAGNDVIYLAPAGDPCRLWPCDLSGSSVRSLLTVAVWLFSCSRYQECCQPQRAPVDDGGHACEQFEKTDRCQKGGGQA